GPRRARFVHLLEPQDVWSDGRQRELRIVSIDAVLRRSEQQRQHDERDRERQLPRRPNRLRTDPAEQPLRGVPLTEAGVPVRAVRATRTVPIRIDRTGSCVGVRRAWMGARRSNAGARASTTWSATATWSTATRVHDAVPGAVDLADSSAHRLLSLSDHATDLPARIGRNRGGKCCRRRGRRRTHTREAIRPGRGGQREDERAQGEDGKDCARLEGPLRSLPQEPHVVLPPSDIPAAGPSGVAISVYP